MDVVAGLLIAILLGVLVLGLAIPVAINWRERSRTSSVSWRLAQARAEALLQEMLTATEYVQLGERGYLEVPSPSQPTRTYRVPQKGGRVAIIEGGVEVESLCVTPIESIPPGDVVLTHKLMIEGNEQEYLRRANHYRLTTPTRFPGAGY
jgi:hypothetical protein